MNDFLDEETVTLTRDASDQDALGLETTPLLESANPLKFHTKYTNALQQYGFFDNRILSASSEVLSMAVSISRMPHPEDLYVFRNGLKRMISDLKSKISILDYPPSVSDKVCFLFCIMLDEQILHSEWGEESSWENQTLVSELFGMKNGGEQFFSVAERALAQPAMLVDLLELIYVLLKMGFKGQYRTNGNDQLEALLKRLETAIFSQRIITEEKEGYGVDLVQDMSRMKFAKPKRPAKYWRQFIVFFLLIGSVLTAASYWYDKTLPQRAKDFNGLEKFSENYYKPNDDKEFTYISTPQEMTMYPDSIVSSAPVNAQDKPVSSAKTAKTSVSSDAAKVPVEKASSPLTSTKPDKTWKVQMATFSTRKAANSFVAKMKGEGISDVKIVAWKTVFRVFVELDTKASAEATLKKVQSLGIHDAFIISGA